MLWIALNAVEWTEETGATEALTDAKSPVQIVYFWGRLTQVNANLTSVHISSHFPGGRGLANTRISPFWILLEITMMEVVVTTGAIRRAKLQSNHHHQQTNTQFLQAGCPSCRQTNSVRALNVKNLVSISKELKCLVYCEMCECTYNHRCKKRSRKK